MERQKLWVSAIFLFVVGDAIALQTRGPLLANLQSSFNVSQGLLGLVAPAGTLGFVVAVVVVGFVAGQIDFNRGLVLGVSITAGCLLLMAASPTYGLFLLFLVGQGTATGVVRGLDRPILSHLYPSQRGRMFSLHALAWALGAVIGPLFVNAVLSVADWRVTYLILGLFFLPVAVLLFRLELSDDAIEERKLSRSALMRLMQRPAILGMTVTLIIIGLIEGIIYTWLPYYAAEFISRESANLLLSVYLLAYIPGRILYSSIAGRFRYIDLSIALGIVSLPMFYLVFTGGGALKLFTAMFVAGFFFSGFFPFLSAFGVDAAPKFSGPVSAIATAATYLGMAVGPVGIGLLAEEMELELVMTIPIGLLVSLIVVLVVARFTVADTAVHG